MAQLSTIISSILRDMIVAQHEANMYAMSLEDVYKQNGRLEQFALPTVAVGEVELDLRYGVKSDSSQTEQYEINYPLLRKVAKQISVDFAKAIIKSTLPVLQSLFPEDGTDSGTKVLANFAIDDNLTALAWCDVQGSVCFIPNKLDFREFTLLVIIVVTLVLIERKITVCTRMLRSKIMRK